MKNTWILGLSVGTIALAAAVPAQAAADNPTQDGNWSDSSTWGGTLPDSNSSITNGHVVTINNADGRIDPLNPVPWTFSTYSGRNGTLNIDDGAQLTWATSTGLAVQANVNGQTSHVIMTGGTLTATNADGKITIANNASSTTITGTFAQSGGTVDLQNGSDLQLTLPAGAAGGSGTYTLSGTGLLKIGGDLIGGTGTGIFNFNGGTLVHNGLLMNLTNGGGTLAPGGVETVGTALLKGTATGSAGYDYTQNSGTLAIDIGATGYDQLVGTGATIGSNNVLLNGTLQINVLPGATLTDNETFDIVTTADILNSSITGNATLNVIGLTTGSFSKSIIDNPNGADVLRLTYSSAAVPEPASLSVLAIGGLTLLRRRRRRA